MKIEIQAKRIYEAVSSEDGVRILVDRLWPRGVSKEKAQIDVWPKELTPSTELRKWYHAHPALFEKFASRYRDELHSQQAEITALLQSVNSPVITLVSAVKDISSGHVIVLQEYLQERLVTHRLD